MAWGSTDLADTEGELEGGVSGGHSSGPPGFCSVFIIGTRHTCHYTTHTYTHTHTLKLAKVAKVTHLGSSLLESKSHWQETPSNCL